MHAAFAADTSRPNQFEVSLIGQGGRLQGVAGPAPSQVPPGDSAQFGVNEGHQAAERLFISAAPSGNQPADVPRTLDGHGGADLTIKNPYP